jgi:hypothetical protein
VKKIAEQYPGQCGRIERQSQTCRQRVEESLGEKSAWSIVGSTSLRAGDGSREEGQSVSK